MHSVDFYAPHRMLYIFLGGDGRAYFNTVFTFHVDAVTWAQPECTGSPPTPRASHGSAIVGNNLIICGGWNGTSRLNDVHILNLGADSPAPLGHHNPASGSAPVYESIPNFISHTLSLTLHHVAAAFLSRIDRFFVLDGSDSTRYPAQASGWVQLHGHRR